MQLKFWKNFKRWWRCHYWVDVRSNHIIPRRNEVFWLTEWSSEQARKFKKEHPARLYQYRFTPGPIGVCIEIRGDGAGQDITDYGSW